MSEHKRDGSKLSFADLDKLRRERKHGRAESGRVNQATQSHAEKSYRAALERAFDSGRLAEFAATLQRSRDPFGSTAPRSNAPLVDERLTARPEGAVSSEADEEPAEATPPARPQPVSPERAEKRKLAQKILQAEAPRDIGKAIDQYLERYQELPKDYDVLEKALSHPRATVVVRALEQVESLVAKQKPRRSRSLSVQLSILEDTHDDPEVRDRAARIRAAL